MKKVKVILSCPTLFDPRDCSPPGSSVLGILQARKLEWVAIPCSKGSSQPRDWTRVFCIAGRFFTIWAIREALSMYEEMPRVCAQWNHAFDWLIDWLILFIFGYHGSFFFFFYYLFIWLHQVLGSLVWTHGIQFSDQASNPRHWQCRLRHWTSREVPAMGLRCCMSGVFL